MRQGSVQMQAKKKRQNNYQTMPMFLGEAKLYHPGKGSVPHLLNLTSAFFKRWSPEDFQVCQSEEAFRNGYMFG